ncbi:MAG: hypothetical protein ACLU45_01700 [Dialister invisus]|uniref:hypothetical protein n=1 Tax=Dialister invisus TaxID=218538 RepID=UPI003999ABE0
MATSNARIQFSIADEETWKSVNPMLREGELVIAKKPSGKYRLYVGAKGEASLKIQLSSGMKNWQIRTKRMQQ